MEVKKNPDADTDNVGTRLGFVGIGLLVALSVVLISFELKSGILPLPLLAQYADDMDEEVVEEIMSQTPPPPPPPPPPPVVVQDVEVVEDDKEEDDISLEVNEDTVIVIDIPDEEPEIEIDAIADIVEEKAEYPGGQSALLAWLNKNIEYPEIAAESNIQGRVFVQFVVEKDGSISDVKTIGKVPHKALGKEAVKKVKRIPGKWTPGKNNGKAVRSYFKLPVMFRLK